MLNYLWKEFRNVIHAILIPLPSCLMIIKKKHIVNLDYFDDDGIDICDIVSFPVYNNSHNSRLSCNE